MTPRIEKALACTVYWSFQAVFIAFVIAALLFCVTLYGYIAYLGAKEAWVYGPFKTLGWIGLFGIMLALFITIGYNLERAYRWAKPRC